MPVFDIFSKRQRRLRGDLPDVYTYDDLPEPLRVQIIQIWKDTLGDPRGSGSEGPFHAYEFIVEALRREYGVFSLPQWDEYPDPPFMKELAGFFLRTKDIEKAMDVIELSFQMIDRATRDFHYMYHTNASEKADEAIAELNMRFKEHGVGYQFAEGKIIRMDSEFVHAEVVKPALQLLRRRQYAGAQQEFLRAHEHYRRGNAKEALNECLKAFESVMKATCHKRGWKTGKSGTASELIQTCLENHLIPAFWQQHYASLRSLLESSVPTARNRLSGHGQGETPVSVPDHLVSYMLHMTASAIVFLAEAEAALP